MKPKNQELKKAILDTTTKLVIEQGIEGTSTVKVARQLKISQSNIYSYFKNKQALMLAVFHLHQTKLIDYLTASSTTVSSAEGQIDHLLTGLIRFGLEQAESLQVIITFRQTVSMRAILPTIDDDPFFHAQFKLITQYQKDHIIKDYPAQFLAEGAFSIINNYLIGIHSGEFNSETLSQTAVIELVKSFLLVG